MTARHAQAPQHERKSWWARIVRILLVRYRIVTVPVLLIVVLLTVGAVRGGGSSAVHPPDTPPSLVPATALTSAAPAVHS